ncbi:MAG: MFS transporter [Clostridiales bacterium]|jgi:fucose permease|nr:MFS transporter [Clostridiales bacterium]
MAILFLLLIYLTFISLGLPDSLLGAVWPVMRVELGAPLDAAGIVFIVISGGTIISSLLCPAIIKRFKMRGVTIASVFITALAIICSGFVKNIWALTLLAVPLGLGAGAIDSALNNFVALNYKARHMSWLHAFWGIGALTGPLIIGVFLRQNGAWRSAYFTLGSIQLAVGALLLFATPLWRKFDVAQENADGASEASDKVNVLKIPGVKPALITFFVYCATEYTVGLWGASFLTELRGFSKAGAATAVSLYYIGITAGRIITGFLTARFSGERLIRGGIIIVTAGALLLAAPVGIAPMAALLVIGLGCSPVYPCMVQLAPKRFGVANSQRVISLQMACAYTGSTFVPPLAGIIAANTTIGVIPVFLLAYCVVMLFMSEMVNKAANRGRG